MGHKVPPAMTRQQCAITAEFIQCAGHLNEAREYRAPILSLPNNLPHVILMVGEPTEEKKITKRVLENFSFLLREEFILHK